jgi:uncharacterized membrane protein
MSDISVMIAAFLTAAVEWVEAFTIVLAVALAIGWQRAIIAGLAALAVLATLTLFGASAISAIGNLRIAQFIIGVFLLLFGLRWLAKAIARGAGLKPLHDEAKAFAKLSASQALAETRGAMLVAFQGVLFEGLEVWLIVVALGVQTGHTAAAAGAAIVALAVVMIIGSALRAPLARVPENTIKFVVGCAILSFGTFWTLAALGYQWPLRDYTLPVLLGFYAAGGLVLIRVLKQPADWTTR